MPDFLAAIQNNQPDELLAIRALEILESETNGSHQIYWAAKYIHSFNNEDSRYDRKILDVLDKLIEAGLSYNKFPEIFLDISKILAQLCFKYNNFKKANNYLLYFRDLSKDWPNWVYNYSAKLLYKLEIETLIINPEPFFKLIDKTSLSISDKNTQSTAIVREFILELYDYFNTYEDQREKYFSLLIKLRDLISPHLKSIEPDWTSFISLSSDVRFSPDLSSEIADLKSAQINIEILRYLLDSSSQEVARLRSTAETQQENIATLEKLLQEKDVQFAEQIKQIAEIQQTTTLVTNVSTIKILILGANSININIIYGIARDFGIAKSQIEVHCDYDENKRYNIERIRYNSPFSGILLGPIAHKVTGLGDNPSLTSKLRSEVGYPPFVEVRTKSGSLKITKSSFKKALEILLNTINANTPD